MLALRRATQSMAQVGVRAGVRRTMASVTTPATFIRPSVTSFSTHLAKRNAAACSLPSFATSVPTTVQTAWTGQRDFHSSTQSLARQSAIVTPSATLTKDDERERAPKSIPLQKFLSKVYGSASLGVLGYLGSAGTLAATGIAFTSSTPLMIGGLVGALGSSVVMAKGPSGFQNVAGEGVVAVDSTARKLAYATLVTSFGAMSAPLIGAMAVMNPLAIPAAGFATVATMGGASLYALRASDDAINAWRPALTGGIFGLIGVSLGGMAAQYFGNPALASALLSINTYGGVLLFAGFTAYDTKIAMDMHAVGQPDHLGAASQMFMNFANLFQRFLIIFGDRE